MARKWKKVAPQRRRKRRGPDTAAHLVGGAGRSAKLVAMGADDERNDDDVTVWFNPSCSKCRGARDLLGTHGVDASYVEYLQETPSRSELERVLGLLGLGDDPRVMRRTSEPVYRELGLGDASVGRDQLLDAMVANPILIERPIVIRGDRAVIGRPPEKLLELLG
jgi:arsenate reductase